jgi:hypothetical protein
VGVPRTPTGYVKPALPIALIKLRSDFDGGDSGSPDYWWSVISDQ